MRFLLTSIVWIVVLGGVWSYTRQRAEAEGQITRQEFVIESVEQRYMLAVTPTFSVEADPFALQLESSPTDSLVLMLNGRQLPVPSEQLRRGESLLLNDIAGLVQGDNEIYIEASPPVSESGLQHAIRVQLKNNGVPVVDDTLWSEEGSLVAGTLHFNLERRGRNHDH